MGTIFYFIDKIDPLKPFTNKATAFRKTEKGIVNLVTKKQSRFKSNLGLKAINFCLIER